ncbi:MAG: flagellar basal body-associated FliL family protein [Georgfuchsia sp.]
MDTAITENSGISVDEEQKPVRRKRLPLIIATLVLLVAIGGGASWFMSQEHATTNDVPVQKKESAPTYVPIYVPLESFTVNLQYEGSDQFLQVVMSLKISEESTAEKLKTFMPEVRNRLLFLLSSKRASELTTTAGKEKLSREIMAEVNRLLDPDAAGNRPSEDSVAAAAPDGLAAQIAALDAPTVSDVATAPLPAAEMEPPVAPEDLPVLGVIFTSFLIQ